MNLQVLSWHYEAFYNTKIRINVVTFESNVVLLIYSLWATLSMNCQLSQPPFIMLVKNHSIIVSERVMSIFKACPTRWLKRGNLLYVSEFRHLGVPDNNIIYVVVQIVIHIWLISTIIWSPASICSLLAMISMWNNLAPEDIITCCEFSETRSVRLELHG